MAISIDHNLALTIVLRPREDLLVPRGEWVLLTLQPDEYVMLSHGAPVAPTPPVAPTQPQTQSVVTVQTPPRIVSAQSVLRAAVLPRDEVVKRPNRHDDPRKQIRALTNMMMTQPGRFVHIMMGLTQPFTVNDIYPHLLPMDKTKSVSPALSLLYAMGAFTRIRGKGGLFRYTLTELGKKAYLDTNFACFTRYGLQVPQPLSGERSEPASVATTTTTQTPPVARQPTTNKLTTVPLEQLADKLSEKRVATTRDALRSTTGLTHAADAVNATRRPT